MGLGEAPRFLLHPTFLLYIALGLGIANLWRGRKESRGRLLWVTVPFLLLSVACTRASQYLMHVALEWPYRLLKAVPGDAQAIVVLSGAVRGVDGTLREPELGTDTLYRCLHAARLHEKARSLPILVSGGPIEASRSYPATSIAQLMRGFLVGQGVADASLIVEGRSRNTYENAVESSKLLRERGIRRIVLVTDAEHMFRASACFRKQGMEVTPSPVRPTERILNNLDDYLPHFREAGDLESSVFEWEKIVYYWLRGRL
jgi:uncharacterized SAM-binding protein YcdF (DUF218 family)